MTTLSPSFHKAQEAECAVIGSMILDWRVCGEVLDHVKTGDEFSAAKHGAIFTALIELYDSNVQHDMVLLKTKLDNLGVLEQIGGVQYLIELAESVPSASSAHYYAKVVHESFLKRQFMQCAEDISKMSREKGVDIREMIDNAEKKIFDIAAENSSKTTNNISEVLQHTYDELAKGQGDPGVMSGFFSLDDKTNGFKPGELVIIAARPSIGKTAFALMCALNAAVHNDTPAAFFSLEMSREQLGMRIFAALANVDSARMRKRTLVADEFNQLSKATALAASSSLLIDDKSSLSLLEIRTRARRMKETHGIKMIVLDYLQLMETPKSESRQVAVSNLSRGLKTLARELGVAILCLSQLNRAAENRPDNKPKLSDLRESGAIEQDADVVLLLHRDDYFKRDEPNHEPTHAAEVIIAKQRQGPTGVVPLKFYGETMSFHNPDGCRGMF